MNRRTFLTHSGAAFGGLLGTCGCFSSSPPPGESGSNPVHDRAGSRVPRKPHLVTLNFDDGFKKSFTRTAEIHEKYKLSACLNIVAAGFPEAGYLNELERWLPTQVRAFRTGFTAISPLPHPGQVKLTCSSFGPGNAEAAIDREIANLLARESGWLIFNTHGLDEEGWGPIRASYLERLLERLLAIDTVETLPAGRALAKYAS
jgi:peptidoglycan/xylan/chitin deacetylase (PgdA/CDA1 family)